MVCEYCEELGCMPLLHTHENASEVGSQLLEVGPFPLLSICVQRSGHEAFWLVHQVSRVAGSTVEGSMDCPEEVARRETARTTIGESIVAEGGW